ncbi:MAG: hypothetical protein M3R27_05870 [Bacteroidota bacterium]|nr:hypothetical protein [Bacteroidota bacterium]
MVTKQKDFTFGHFLTILGMLCSLSLVTLGWGFKIEQKNSDQDKSTAIHDVQIISNSAKINGQDEQMNKMMEKNAERLDKIDAKLTQLLIEMQNKQNR